MAAVAQSPALSGSHFSPDAWYFTKDELRQSPSVRDGYTPQQETKERRTVCAFLQETGKKLGLPQLSIATGIVFFHRFFALHSFKDYDGHIIGIACIFLAAKVEETPKKLRDVILASDSVRPSDSSAKTPLTPESEQYIWLKDNVLQGERAVLQTMAFELTIDHPYKYVLNYVKAFRGNQTDKQTKEVAQITWNFVNDSLRTTLCLEYRPQVIAAAALLLAARKYAADHNQPVHLPDTANAKGEMKPWYESLELGITIADLEDCSAQIADLYEGSALGSQLNKTPTDGSLQASGSTTSTPTPVSPSPGSFVLTISPAPAPAAATRGTPGVASRNQDIGSSSRPLEGSGSSRPAGNNTMESKVKNEKEVEQPRAQQGERATTATSSAAAAAASSSTAVGDGGEKDKERKDAIRDKRVQMKQEERNERKYRPY